MGYDAATYQKALQIVTQRREMALMDADRRKEQLYRSVAGLAEADHAIAATAAKLTRQFLSGADISALRSENLSLQDKRLQLLSDAGVNPDELQPHFICPRCSDAGYDNGKLCRCVKELARKLAYEALNEETPLHDCTFSSFSLDKYPEEADDGGVIPRRRMEKILKSCRKYADEFSITSESLLFFGATGLGKTHLSLSIANEVIAKGYGVVYGPVSHILNRISNEHFSNSNQTQTLSSVLDCDLLILDDLGSEFATSFVSATVYEIVNSRLLSKKPTIINTNLSLEEMERRYSERVVSRIAGCYRMYPFIGEDIRTLNAM